MKISLIYVPCSNKQEATKIAKTLVVANLAACVNIIDPISSIYKWEGKVEESTETLIFIKTKKSLVKKVREKIIALHSYEIPCISEIELNSINQPFVDWVAGQCKT
jgi:periplasmic divalent cation tolerance protein